MAKKSSNKVSAVNLFKKKPKKNNKGVHSKNNKPEKKYRGQGKL